MGNLFNINRRNLARMRCKKAGRDRSDFGELSIQPKLVSREEVLTGLIDGFIPVMYGRRMRAR